MYRSTFIIPGPGLLIVNDSATIDPINPTRFHPSTARRGPPFLSQSYKVSSIHCKTWPSIPQSILQGFIHPLHDVALHFSVNPTRFHPSTARRGSPFLSQSYKVSSIHCKTWPSIPQSILQGFIHPLQDVALHSSVNPTRFHPSTARRGPPFLSQSYKVSSTHCKTWPSIPQRYVSVQSSRCLKTQSLS